MSVSPAVAVLLGAIAASEPSEDVIDAIRTAAEFERRQRSLAGGLGVAAGGAQLTAGILLATKHADSGSAVSRATRIHVVGGSAVMLVGLATLLVPGPLSKLERGASFQRLADAPGSWAARSSFERTWKSAARRAKIGRLVAGSVAIAGSTGLGTFAVVQLSSAGRDTDDALVDAAMLVTAAGVLGTGITSLLLRTELERAYDRHRERRQLSLGVGPGSVSITGRF